MKAVSEVIHKPSNTCRLCLVNPYFLLSSSPFSEICPRPSKLILDSEGDAGEPDSSEGRACGLGYRVQG